MVGDFFVTLSKFSVIKDKRSDLQAKDNKGLVFAFIGIDSSGIGYKKHMSYLC
tara:strand:- start:436 stop:594 length:159 start_codon:yes stop_codon:yes gene_type:complete